MDGPECFIKEITDAPIELPPPKTQANSAWQELQPPFPGAVLAEQIASRMCRLSDGIPRALKRAVADEFDEFRSKERKVYFLDRESFTGYLETQ